ncbi:RNA polymerase sigma factor [Aquisphaera giovannonii]|uniref:RNA polymerase sigma factor n=1 Tax=Aquisphaera giovannonii TaxID=406548 RepID=A0A5B9VWW6_9BACT|nr:sigma-70 family RNA polymerase sigma factor [Aquisphaera giovannonii]QEH32599.1 RNA polymerase sigma factor [Aquisphaera giovannonii]
MRQDQSGGGERPADAPSAAHLVEHFFRRESGRLVAVLARVFGLRHLDLVEDMVQASLLEALQAWRAGGVPDDPSAWMHRVARNKVLDALRHRETVLRLAPSYARLRPMAAAPDLDDLFLDSGIADSQLRLMFACCHPALAVEDQIALTLKSLGGFGNAEIARGLLVSEETVKKRTQRARRELADRGVELAVPHADELPARLDAVHRGLYLLFNEGYSATSGDSVLRLDLCEEAARLCHLLGEHPLCRTPATLALLSLMLFHAARFDARTDGDGRLLLMEDQDRSRWDRALIARARAFLDESAAGRSVSIFHLEAGIALVHCEAPRFEETDWPAILRLYDALIARRPSAIYRLNRAIVLAHVAGPAAGLDELGALAGDPALRHYHLLDATLGELHRRAGNLDRAREHLARARDRTQSARERELLDRRLDSCGGGPP